MSFKSEFKEKYWSLSFFFFLVLFFVFKYVNHIHLGIFDLEEFYKTQFAFKDKNFIYFFPGNHGEKDFYGHPGFNNFLFYLFSKVFGDSIASVRLFSLSLSVGLIASIYAYISGISNRRTGFLVSLTLLAMPMFHVQSIMFFNELPSLLFMFISLFFFNRKKWLCFSVFGVFSVLTLESSVAVYVALAALNFPSVRRHIKGGEFKELFAYLAPILMLVAFFVVEKNQTGNFSNHVTSESVASRLMDVKGAIAGGVLWSSLGQTLVSNISVVVLALFPIAVLFFFYSYRKKISFQAPVVLMLLTSTFYLLYFGYLSEYSGGRDYYFVLITCFFIFYHALSSVAKAPLLVSILILVETAVFSYRQLYTQEDFTQFQTSYYEYEGRRDFQRLVSGLSELDNSIRCHRYGFGNFFCNEGYGIKPSNVLMVDDFAEPTYVIETEGALDSFIANQDGNVRELDRVLLAEIRGQRFYALKLVENKSSE